jgi:hypothetical protein
MFLRHLRPLWEVHRHWVAPSVAADIKAARARGALQIMTGQLDAIEPAAHGLTVRWRPRGESVLRELAVQRVINCSGPLTELLARRLPGSAPAGLTSNVQASGRASRCAWVTWSNCAGRTGNQAFPAPACIDRSGLCCVSATDFSNPRIPYVASRHYIGPNQRGPRMVRAVTEDGFR